MGQPSISVTPGRYGHLFPELDEAIAVGFGERIAEVRRLRWMRATTLQPRLRHTRRLRFEHQFCLGERAMAKNTGKGHRVGAVESRSEFKHNGNWFKRDTGTGRTMSGSPKQHEGVRNER